MKFSFFPPKIYLLSVLSVAFLLTGCNKAPDSKPDKVPVVLKDKLPQALNPTNPADTSLEDSLTSNSNITVFPGSIIKVVDIVASDTASATLPELEVVRNVTLNTDYIDCDTLEEDSLDLDYPYDLPDEYLFEDEGSVPDDITFAELPIFKAPMTPALCYLRNYILYDANYEFMDRALEAIHSHDDIEDANYDMFLINVLSNQALVASSTADNSTSIDGNNIFNKLLVFASYLENKKNGDENQWEENRTNVGFVAGVAIGGASFISRILSRKIHLLEGSRRLASWIIGPYTMESKPIAGFIRLIGKGLNRMDERKVTKALKDGVIVSAEGYGSYFIFKQASGLYFSRGLAELEDHNILSDDILNIDDATGELTKEEIAHFLEIIRRDIR